MFLGVNMKRSLKDINTTYLDFIKRCQRHKNI